MEYTTHGWLLCLSFDVGFFFLPPSVFILAARSVYLKQSRSPCSNKQPHTVREEKGKKQQQGIYVCIGERTADRVRKRTAGKEHGREGSRNDDLAVMEPTVGRPRAVCRKANKWHSVLGPRNIFSVVSQQRWKAQHPHQRNVVSGNTVLTKVPIPKAMTGFSLPYRIRTILGRWF